MASDRRFQMLVYLMVFFLLTAGCGGAAEGTPIEQAEEKQPAASPDEPPAAEEIACSAPPESIDEQRFEGDRREIVKLLNRYLQSIAEENTVAYRELLAPDSPLDADRLPRYKIQSIHLIDEIRVTEQQNVIQGVAQAEVATCDGGVNATLYVFLKEKQPEAHWRIMDID